MLQVKPVRGADGQTYLPFYAKEYPYSNHFVTDIHMDGNVFMSTEQYYFYKWENPEWMIHKTTISLEKRKFSVITLRNKNCYTKPTQWRRKQLGEMCKILTRTNGMKFPTR